MQTGYEQHIKEGGCSSGKKGEQRHSEHTDRLTRLEQLVRRAPRTAARPGHLSSPWHGRPALLSVLSVPLSRIHICACTPLSLPTVGLWDGDASNCRSLPRGIPAVQVAVAEEYVPGSLSGAGAFDADLDAAGGAGDGGGGASGAGHAASPRSLPGSPPPARAQATSRSLCLQQAQNFLDEAALYSSATGGGAWGGGGGWGRA